MNDNAARAPVATVPAADAAAQTLVVAVVLAFADTQLVQWTSMAMRPALVAFSLGINLALFVTVAAVLALASRWAAKLMPGAAGLLATTPAIGAAAVWLLSRLRLAALQEAGPPVGVLVPCVLLAVLGIGVAWLARSLTRDPWRAVAALVAINAALLLVTFPILPGIERPSRADATAAGVASPAAAGAPNVIIIVLDTLRADHMSTYGYEYDTTPNIDAFAAGATVFEPGIANATWSLTSHASLLTGLLPHQHGAHAVLASISQSAEERGAGSAAETFALAQRPLAAEHETLAESLAARGYATAAVVANFGWLSDFFGLLQGFDYIDSRPMNLFPREPVAAPYVRRLPWQGINDRYILLNKSAWFGDAIVAHALAWEARRPDGPFFLFLNFMDAHAPFRASLMTADYDGHLPDPDPEGDPTSYSIARYDRSIAYLDRQVGALLDDLRERDLFDNSLIVITSDHGENFAPDRPASHGAELLQDTVVVPLIIKMPGQTTGDRPGRPGQLVDVVPTVRRVVGLDLDPDMFGSPLAERPRAIVAENYFSGLYGAYADEFVGTEEEMLAAFPSRWALFEGPWKLVRPVAGIPRLYDLAADPAGRRDVSGRHPEIAEAMALRLSELLPERAFNAARSVTPVALPDALTIERLRSLGYLR